MLYNCVAATSYGMDKNVATISPKITKGEELVVIPRSLYERFSRLEKETEEVQNIVKRGRKALREGRTFVVSSPKDLLKK